MSALPLPGTHWRSRDKRDDGLVVTVLKVESSRVQIQRVNKVWVRRDRFRNSYLPVTEGQEE